MRVDTSADMRAEHEAYKNAIDETYAEEQQNFNAQWERRLDEFNQMAARKMELITTELEEKLKLLDQKFTSKPVRFSAAVI